MSTNTQEKSHEEHALQQTFDWLADRYLAQTHLVSGWQYRRWMDHVCRLVQPWHPQAIVDVGCGPGYLLAALHSAMPECALIGVDDSPRMLDHVPPSIVTRHQSWQDWNQTSSQSYDVVIMTFVLRDQVDSLATVRAMRHHIKPTGHLVILETHTPAGLPGWGFRLYFHHFMPWWADIRLTPDWPKTQGPSPYRRLSSSHHRWTQTESLREVLLQGGYGDITEHASAASVVELWTAQPDRRSAIKA